jgi:LPS-assembly protein
VCLAPADPSSREANAKAPAADEQAHSLTIEAGQIDLERNTSASFSDEVRVRLDDGRLAADRATYDPAAQTLTIAGRVTYTDPDVSVYGEDAKLDAANEQVSFARAGFELPKRPARGSAEQILVERAGSMSLSSVEFTTCPVDRVDWELLARQLKLDSQKGFGTARGVKLKFKGVPVFYAPYFTFPINDQRKSGFLTPQIAERDRTGLDIAVPYYLNLAPNYDLTLEPRYLGKRGMQLNSRFRYLMPRSDGRFALEYLPNDSETKQDRSYVNLRHRTAFGRGWQLLAGIEEVSDARYFEDLGDSLSITSQTHLNRFIDLGYFASRWSLVTRLQNYQTIDTQIAPDNEPYQRVPQMLFHGRWLKSVLGFDSTTELVSFDRDVGTTGLRFDSTQELSLRFARGGMYLTPAVALRQTNYWLSEPVAGGDDTLSRSVPISSLDAGLKFERSTRHSGWLQTLEPRLLYVHVPYRDQSELPVFDTIVPDFNLVQLFRKYRYVGPDRIADTDQVSFGITTRFIDTGTGRERLAATLGQTRYLSDQQVSLPDQPVNDANASDYVAELGVNMTDKWNMDLGYQWNSTTDSTARVESRFEYRPQQDRLFGFGYRYRPDLLEQGDLSLVWPVGDRWRMIGRYSYSLLERKPLEQFFGWEYESCCWRLRVVSRRYVSRRTGETDSSISFQLELKGLGQRAASPEELLDRGILGYRRFEGATTQ